MKKTIHIIVTILSLFTHHAMAAPFNALLADERNTIEVYQKASPKVVYVNRLARSKFSFRKKQEFDGAGSGVIWDNRGHIVTNYHVIHGANSLSITLGEMTVPAKIVGKDSRRDIAVLSVDSPKALAYLKDFKPFQIVPVAQLSVGQKAIAIGNPYGLEHSLSKGVISALGRKVPGAGGVTIPNMIQTDTSINPGNSGGPLLDSSGDLIGINSMIFSPSGTSAGIGFAMPAADIDKVVTQIIQHGHAVTPGIGVRQAAPQLASKLGIKKGILIEKVLPRSPAQKAQLRALRKDNRGRMVAGDVIMAIDHHPIESYDVFYKLLSDMDVGQKIVVSIKRGDKSMDVTLNTIDISTLG